jgi:hypothetical protein
MYGTAVLDKSSTDALIDSCDHYLGSRTGRYEWRCVRYNAAIQRIKLPGDALTVCDVGAGWTEFGRRLWELGFRGRYWPVDGGLDGTDLESWTPPRDVDWFVGLEILEHLHNPWRLVEAMKRRARAGIVVSTPNPHTTDVLGMDATHVTPITPEELSAHGFEVEVRSFYGEPDDSVFGVWRR